MDKSREADSLDVSLQFLSAAHGPVVSMEGCLYQRSHHASHGSFIATAVALAVMFHSQTVHKDTEKNKDFVFPQTRIIKKENLTHKSTKNNIR